MNDLIEALTIFSKYCDDPYSPTGCEHDVLYVYSGHPDGKEPGDVARLRELGFEWDDDIEVWSSFRFGSA